MEGGGVERWGDECTECVESRPAMRRSLAGLSRKALTNHKPLTPDPSASKSQKQAGMCGPVARLSQRYLWPALPPRGADQMCYAHECRWPQAVGRRRT